MSNKESRYVFIVEGKTDVDKLFNLGIKYAIPCLGKFIRQEFYSFLKEVIKVRKVVLALDPDNVGIQIKDKLKEFIVSNNGSFLTLKLEKRFCYSNNKFGLANSSSECLKELMKDILEYENEQAKFSSFFLDEDNLLTNKQFRIFLKDKYHLLNSARKSLTKELNILKLDDETIRKDFVEYGQI